MDLKALDKKVKLIEIRSRKAAQNVFSGRYKSIFRGQGMEFDEVREYQYGDDIKNIDWNVTARSTHLYTKKFMEEREQTVMILLDVSGSLKFGTTERLKSELAVETAALIFLAALKNGDKVGLTLFSDKIEQYYRPQKKKDQIFQVIRELLVYPPTGNGSDLKSALEFVNRVQKKRAIIFVLSDMLTSGHEQALYLLSRRHDVFVFFVNDPAEKAIGKPGSIMFQDIESGRSVPVGNFQDAEARDRSLADVFFKQQDALLRHNIRSCELMTNGNTVNELIRFFNKNRSSR